MFSSWPTTLTGILLMKISSDLHPFHLSLYFPTTSHSVIQVLPCLFVTLKKVVLDVFSVVWLIKFSLSPCLYLYLSCSFSISIFCVEWLYAYYLDWLVLHNKRGKLLKGTYKHFAILKYQKKCLFCHFIVKILLNVQTGHSVYILVHHCCHLIGLQEETRLFPISYSDAW